MAAFEVSKRRPSARRAERCIGLAIRKGQAEGRIAKRGDQRSDQVRNPDLISPKSFFGNNDEITQTYAMTQAPAEAFEAALAEADAKRRHRPAGGDTR